MKSTQKWIGLGPLSETMTDFAKYNRDIGVYRAILGNEVVYIGKATELENGGLRKRLRDYTRSSDSARNYPSGRMLHQHKDEVRIELLLFERTVASKLAIDRLEAQLIAEIAPKWNLLDN